MTGALLLATIVSPSHSAQVKNAKSPKKEVSLWISRNIAPSEKVRVNLNSRNVREVRLTAQPIDGEKWLINADRDQAMPKPTGPVAKKWTISVAQNQRPNPNSADTYYSRQVNLPPLKPGVYLLTANGGDKAAWGVVNVTNLAVIVKRSPKRALVWVTDFQSGKVLPNSSVNIYSRNGALQSKKATGADGAAMIALAPGDRTFVVRRGADLAGVPTLQEDPDGRLQAHFQTDRPIYRPGQKISFKAILRKTLGQGYSVVSSAPVTVELRDPKDNPLDRVKLTSNAMGSVFGEFEIPEEGATGPYTLVLTQDRQTAYAPVTVAAYRKPEFKVDIAADRRRYLAGEPIEFTVDSQYYFGAPVPQATVNYTVRRSGMGWGAGEEEGWFYSGDGNLYSRDTYANDAVVAEATAYTDAEGKAKISVPTDKGAGDSNYSITATVVDGSNRQVVGSNSVPVYAAGLRLSLSSDLVYASLGSVAPIRIRAVDLDGKPVAAAVTLRLIQPVYDEKKGEWHDKELVKTVVDVPASGSATFGVPAKEAGSLRVEAVADDGSGRKARATYGLYVAGNFNPPTKEKEAPTIEVLLDRKVYEVGSKAKAVVQSNNPTRPVLIVAEGGEIWDYAVLTDLRKAKSWSLATTAKLSPNAFVTVQQWVGTQLVSASAMLPVPDRAKTLKVQAVPDREDYRPGDKATYTVKTSDGTGKPVSAEVALAVVDEAIFALSPDVTRDIYGFYWGMRPNMVQTQASAPEELSGGAYQRVSTIAPVRQRFEDTAYWGPTVTTDASGTAVVSFEMPGNLTQWRATARAVTLGTSVGTGSSKVRANRPVTLRLATPRQLVAGDKLELIGTVNNRTSEEREFEVSLTAEGLTISGDAKHRIRVAANGEGKVRWPISAAAVPPSGSAMLTAEAVDVANRTADSADALRVPLKVVPNGLPFRTVLSGTLTGAAESTLEIPSDRIEPATQLSVEVSGGIAPLLKGIAEDVLTSPRYGSIGAAAQLTVSAATGKTNADKPVRESLALLSRTGRYDGWGPWENAASDPIVTAQVASALGRAKGAGITVYDALLASGREAVVQRYNATNLWEHRARLAAAATEIGAPKAADLVSEVLDRGERLSPFARLRLIEALIVQGKRDLAESKLGEVLALVNRGAAESYLPAGEGTEWAASDVETTAEALYVLATLGANEDALQTQFARWLASPEASWRSTTDDAAVVRALSAYSRNHPQNTTLGRVTVEVNGRAFEAKSSSVAERAIATIDREALVNGANSISIRREGGSGEAFFTIESRVYRPISSETTDGVRVLRRYEVKNEGGVWVELNRPVRTGEPVRCTVLAWGDDLRDQVRVVQPIPAGFEFIEDASENSGYQEVRDGAVVHYVTNSGSPQTFRYYLRAESEGELTALPATAEYIKRPKMRGNTVPVRVVVATPLGRP